MNRIQRIAFVAGLLLFGVAPALALQTAWNSVGGDSWTTALAWTGGIPGANDTAVFDGTGVGSCLINDAAVCNRIVISAASQSLTIAATRSLTVGVGGFSFTNGAFNDGGRPVTISGPCSIVTPAALTSTGTWTQVASGNVANATSTNAFAQWRVSDAGAGSIVATRTANVYCKLLHLGIGDSIKGAFVTYMLPTANNFIADSGGGSTGGVTDIYLAGTLAASTAAYPISIGDSVYIHAAANTDTLSLGAAFSVGDLVIDTVTFMDSTQVVTSSGNLIIGDDAVITSTGLWNITGNGYVKNKLSANKFNALVIAGTGTIIVNRSDNVYVESLSIGTADSVKGAYTFFIVPDQNYFFGNSGVVTGGWTDIYMGIDGTLNGFTVQEPLTIRGAGIEDSLIPLGPIGASGLTIGTSVSFVDDGYAISSAGDITIHDTATTLHSTGVWWQTAAGTTVNRRPSNAFANYVVTTTCTDTIFYNPTVAGDTFAVTGIFLANGTRGSTFLYGKPGGTIMSLPAAATANACDIENIYASGHVLRAVGCASRGHGSGVLCQQ